MNYAERDAASHRDRANVPVQGYRRDQLNRAREQEEKEKKYAQLMTGYSSTMGYSKPNAIGRGRHFDEDQWVTILYTPCYGCASFQQP